jgi:hypothetical protein
MFVSDSVLLCFGTLWGFPVDFGCRGFNGFGSGVFGSGGFPTGCFFLPRTISPPDKFSHFGLSHFRLFNFVGAHAPRAALWPQLLTYLSILGVIRPVAHVIFG